MKTILEELYHGNIRPDGRHYSQDSEFVRQARIKCENLDKLMRILNEQQKEIFDAYYEAQGEIDSITRYDKFTYGFRLGTLLMMEVASGMEELL